jgi:8-oxo-dGTP pyrophosphatase MutT (NUDIX family)
MAQAKVKREISAGGVIFRKGNIAYEVALTSRDNGKVWCLPKGLVDKGEKLEETALREVKEETGLAGRIIEKIDEVKYWYYSKWEKVRVFKSVHFYLMECQGGNVEEHDFEVDEVRWFPLEEAVKLLSYKSEREIVAKAEVILFNPTMGSSPSQPAA